VASAVVAWALLGLPPARASCAGPQLALSQEGERLAPRRVGSGEAERVVHDVGLGSPLTLTASNLTRTCVDTYGGAGGCAPSVAEPVVAPSQDPMTGAELVLVQGERRWSLAVLDTISPELTAEVTVDLPGDVRPGPAALQLDDGPEGIGTVSDVVLHR
jgi:hypothetical protein